jgi:CubicO group peptidase (beta-lactamase class C family)
MVYEIGPRSRVWTYNTDVECHGDTVRWNDKEGILSRNKDTMRVTLAEAGGETRWLYVRDRSADSLLSQLRSNKSRPYTYRIPEDRYDGWQCADLTASRIKSSRIIDLVEQIRKGKHDDIHSLLLIKDNRLVVEEYFADNGSKQGPLITQLFQDKVHHLASTTKCVTSALIGIAIDHGFINSVEDPIYRYLPAYASLFNDEKRLIRISHMLTMTPGFTWRQFGVSESQNDGMQMWWTDDVIEYVLSKSLETEPGKKFNYTNGVPTVTGEIIKNSSKLEVSNFAEKYLFHPLGITDYIWTSYPDGSIETDGGLALRPRDLAKIGQLFLDKGIWNGTRIVSEDWVLESTKERLRFDSSNRWGYGYHWMQAESRIGARIVHSYFVPGDGNQILAVFPELRMVVVLTAGNYGRDPKSTYYSLFEKFILPAVIYGG